MILMWQIFDAIANENVRYKRNELESSFQDEYWRVMIQYCVDHGGYVGCDFHMEDVDLCDSDPERKDRVVMSVEQNVRACLKTMGTPSDNADCAQTSVECNYDDSVENNDETGRGLSNRPYLLGSKTRIKPG